MEKTLKELHELKKCGCVESFHQKWEGSMKSGIRDTVEGKFHEVKGKVKEVAGKLTDNPKLHVDDTVEKIVGKVQEKAQSTPEWRKNL
jgi:uncharacterized protein YjbJ (UPF0337 family)